MTAQQRADAERALDDWSDRREEKQRERNANQVKARRAFDAHTYWVPIRPGKENS